ncbi:MAG: methyl-accepting chemotaxis protein [Polyangiaceae bacterium]
MPSDTSKRRFLRLIRAAAKGAPGSAASRAASDENAFWRAHEAATTRAREAAQASQRISAVILKHSAVVDALSDRTRAAAGRAQDLRAMFSRISEVFERLGIVALNAGLEGARLGDAAGRAVGLVSDEVRTHAARGSASVHELTNALGEIADELRSLHVALDGSREATASVAEQSAIAANSASEAERALGEIEARIRETTGSDPETARAIAEASEHARALIAAIGNLNTHVAHDVWVEALRPTLEPLVGVLTEEARASEPEPEDE